MKSIGLNTERIKTENAATFVSNFEMFDTYTDLERVTESVDLDAENTLQLTTYSKDGLNVIDDILRYSIEMDNFWLARTDQLSSALQEKQKF